MKITLEMAGLCIPRPSHFEAIILKAPSMEAHKKKHGLLRAFLNGAPASLILNRNQNSLPLIQWM